MKLTWFGGTTLRVHVGGRMLVVEAAAAPDWVDQTELLSGADRTFGVSDDLPAVDPMKWRPQRVSALVDDVDLPEVLVHRLGTNAILVDAAGEAPLVLATGPAPPAGRWAHDAVVVVAGRGLPGTALSILSEFGPRLIAIAGSDSSVEAVIAAVGPDLDGTGLMALEPGLAIEA